METKLYLRCPELAPTASPASFTAIPRVTCRLVPNPIIPCGFVSGKNETTEFDTVPGTVSVPPSLVESIAGPSS